MTVLVTGAAGFIGMQTCERLLRLGRQVVGVDNFNTYYDPRLKRARSARLEAHAAFRMVEMDIAEHEALASLVLQTAPETLIHLAAQAGVRYSLEHPFTYQRSNLQGHLSVLEACRHAPAIRHLIYASSSSVYGDRPLSGSGFREEDPAVEPVSLYAATKRSGELMSAAYSRLYGMGQTGLRFFTVYGPWGRPDMAYFRFTQKILSGDPIEVFGEGRMARDFTYVDDIVDGILGVIEHPAAPGEARILNVGDSHPVPLMEMISLLETALGREAVKHMLPMQPGDVSATYADVSRLNRLCGYQAKVGLKEGLQRFVDWYRGYFG